MVWYQGGSATLDLGVCVRKDRWRRWAKDRRLQLCRTVGRGMDGSVRKRQGGQGGRRGKEEAREASAQEMENRGEQLDAVADTNEIPQVIICVASGGSTSSSLCFPGSLPLASATHSSRDKNTSRAEPLGYGCKLGFRLLHASAPLYGLHGTSVATRSI